MNRNSFLNERLLGDGFSASAVSFGAMGMSEFYGPAPAEEDSLRVLDHVLDCGVTMIDTADMYGRGHNERLIGKLLARRRQEHATGQIQIATKFGLDRDSSDPYKREVNNDPRYIRTCCEQSLQRLGIERIDLYYAHRINPAADLAATMGTLAELVQEGKIAHVGLCEVSAATLEKAHALHPVAAVQSEYSLWTRDAEKEVLPACRALGVGFVAYSPLGRGFLTGAYTSPRQFGEGDFRRSAPRFQQENLEHNKRVLPLLQQVASEYHCTPAQIALAWLLAREPHLVVIPGTRSQTRVEENCAAAQFQLSAETMRQLELVFTPQAVQGERYTLEGMKGSNA